MAPVRLELVLELFEASMKLPRAERCRFLEERCDGDAELLRELLEMVEQDERDGEYMDPPGQTELRSAATGGVGEDLSGTRLGPYRLDRVLGRGGMGAVYLARRVDGDFEQDVAIKLIRRGLDTDDILARFQNERQVLAKLTHPGIARLYDGGATEDGRPYLVMEVVDGMPIDRFCEGRGLEVEERLRLFLRVCEAIQHAHEQRVVHRDLKPSNILVTHDGQPKLLDFGIAKLLDATGSMRTVDVTATELRLMTPEYASPEQVKSGKVDARSDVYALGVILYELLTGQRPYQITTGLRSDLERAICEEEPARPSRRVESRRLRAQLAGDLDTIMLTALRKEPGRRYASVEELAGDVERHLARQPVLARPDTWRYRTSKFVRRNKLLVGSALALFVVLVAGLVGIFAMFLEAEAERKEGRAREYVARIAAAASAVRENDAFDALRHLEAAPPEHRGWEWRHLRAKADSSETTLRGHESDVRAVAWSPAGDRLASGAQDMCVILWDPGSGEELQRWEKLGGHVIDLEFDPAGERLLAVIGRRLVVMLALGQPEPTWTREINAVSATFLPGAEGSRILLALDDGEFVEWDREDDGGETVELADATLGPAEELQMAPGGRRLWTSSRQGRLRIWKVRTEEPEFELDTGTQVLSMVLDPSRLRVASAQADLTVRLRDLTSGASLALCGHRQNVRALEFSPDGAWLASGSGDQTVKLWRTTASPASEIQTDGGWGITLAMAPDGNRIAVGAWGEQREAEAGVAVLELASGEPVWQSLHEIPPARGNQGDAMSLAWSPDGNWIASSARDGAIRIWNARTGELQTEFPRSSDDWMFLGFSTDSERLFAGFRGQRLQVLGLDGQELASTTLPYSVTCLAVDPASGHVALGSYDTISLRSADRRSPIWSREASLEVLELAFSPRGGELAVASQDGRIVLLDLADGSTRRVLEGHQHPVRDLAYSPDGSRLVTASEDTTLKLWDPDDGRELLTLQGHSSGVTQVVFTPDGERIVSQSRNGEVRIWEAPATE